MQPGSDTLATYDVNSPWICTVLSTLANLLFVHIVSCAFLARSFFFLPLRSPRPHAIPRPEHGDLPCSLLWNQPYGDAFHGNAHAHRRSFPSLLLPNTYFRSPCRLCGESTGGPRRTEAGQRLRDGGHRGARRGCNLYLLPSFLPAARFHRLEVRQKSHRSTATIRFHDGAAAARVVSEWHHTYYCGRRISVDYARQGSECYSSLFILVCSMVPLLPFSRLVDCLRSEKMPCTCRCLPRTAVAKQKAPAAVF